MNCAIVLAAGRSRRMGTQKLLLPFAGSTVIARVVDAFLGALVDHLIVVVGPGDETIRNALGTRRVAFVENPNPSGDMLSSLRCALLASPPGTNAYAVSPGDQPLLGPELICEMLAAYVSSDRGILVPVNSGRRGHPLIFSARFQNELLTSFDGIGLRGLLQAHAADIAEWVTSNAAVLQDVDNPSDYEAAVAQAARRDG